MRPQKISKNLLIFGICIVFYAMFIMDVTADGRIVNLNRLNIRQNLVIIGSISTFAGLILMYGNSAQIKDERASNTSRLSIFAKIRRQNRFLSFFMASLGIWLTFNFLFSRKEEVSILTLFFGLLLYIFAVYANRDVASLIHPKMARPLWLIFVAMFGLIISVFFIGIFIL